MWILWVTISIQQLVSRYLLPDLILHKCYREYTPKQRDCQLLEKFTILFSDPHLLWVLDLRLYGSQTVIKFRNTDLHIIYDTVAITAEIF